jgi:hypothetical protein
MHTWWALVCDEHKERVNALTTSSFHLREDLPGEGPLVHAFLEKHRGCKLRLVYSDQDLEACDAAGCVDVSRLTADGKVKYREDVVGFGWPEDAKPPRDGICGKQAPQKETGPKDRWEEV